MLSQASAHLVSVDSSLTFAGYASRLATWDSFELKLMHRYEELLLLQSLFSRLILQRAFHR